MYRLWKCRDELNLVSFIYTMTLSQNFSISTKNYYNSNWQQETEETKPTNCAAERNKIQVPLPSLYTTQPRRGNFAVLYRIYGYVVHKLGDVIYNVYFGHLAR